MHPPPAGRRGPARPRLARRGLVRSVRALAAAALLALSGALALPATAQEQTTFVSNLAKAQGNSSGSIQAQSFSTGSHTAGYMLSKVQLLYRSAGTTADASAIRVKIRTDSSGEPGGLVANLSTPASFANGTIVSFTAPANTMLDAEETYWVVINEGYELASERLAFDQTTSDDETTTTADSNWSIGDGRLWTNTSSLGWGTSSNSLKIAINGSAAGGGTPTCTLNTGDLWCGVVTVGAISSGGSVAAHGFAGADGGLDDKTFSVGTNNYTIDGLYVGTAGDLNLDLTGALDAADKGNLELVVGSTAFDLDDATHVSSENAYLWTGTGLDWSSDTYVTLRMRRAVALSTDATLSGLTVYDGSSNLTLSPSFASGTETYTASAAYDIATVTVTASKNQADATVAWLDASDATLADADAMAAGHQVALEAGGNTFKVKVTAEDGTTTKTYTVTVNRATPTCSLNTGDLWCGVITVGNGTGFDGYVAVSEPRRLVRHDVLGRDQQLHDCRYLRSEVGGFSPGV